MKRIIPLLAALALGAGGCTPVPAPANNANAAAGNANAPASATPAAPRVSEADIRAQEQKVWDAIKAKDWDAFAGSLADDLVYVSEDGVHGKTETVDLVRNIELTELNLSDWKVTIIDADAAVVTYTETSKGTFGGRPFPDRPVRHSAAWLNRGGKWVNVYHQDCYVETPRGTLAPAASPAAAPPNYNAGVAPPPGSPAASPPAVPASPTDTEKAIWDALKRRDYDAFAGFLAPEQLEVGPDAVYDKAGSIEAVRKADFSHVTLSDFREVKLDPDAALVTYVSKSPDKGWPPEGFRHSTLLANRNGRWLSVHHHATVIAKPSAQ